MAGMYIEFTTNNIGLTLMQGPKNRCALSFDDGIIFFRGRKCLGIIGDGFLLVPLDLGENTSHALI